MQLTGWDGANNMRNEHTNFKWEAQLFIPYTGEIKASVIGEYLGWECLQIGS